MGTFSQSLVLVFASLSFAACSQTICPDGSAGNCEASGGTDANGGGNGGDCNDPNAQVCDTLCVDTDVTAAHCGGCGNACAEAEGCAAGECVEACATEGEIRCGGECIDPQTDGQFCGASGGCSGGQKGIDCTADDASCSAGICSTAKRYLGSLAATTGEWNFGGTLGLAGAVTACQTEFGATAVVCSQANMLDAQSKMELVGAADLAGNVISSWWNVDSTKEDVARQCTRTQTKGESPVPVPAADRQAWTYNTQDLDQGSSYTNLDSAAGTIGQPIDAQSIPTAQADGTTSQGCRDKRWVACCNQ